MSEKPSPNPPTAMPPIEIYDDARIREFAEAEEELAALFGPEARLRPALRQPATPT